MSQYRILRLDSSHTKLLDAPHLAEFDAILLDDQATSVSTSPLVPPGRLVEIGEELFTELAVHFRRRTAELSRMIIRGGVLVVRVRAPSAVQMRKPLYGPALPDLVIPRWWADALPALKGTVLSVIQEAKGSHVAVEEPDHMLEPYLLTSSYAAVLDEAIYDSFQEPGILELTRLATNGVGQTVSCQWRIGSGLVLLVPADGDQELLHQCLDNLLAVRRALHDEWKFPEETALLESFRANTEELRQERQTLVAALARIEAIKAPLRDDPDVKRILDRFRAATKNSTSTKQCLDYLYKIVEIIEDRLGGGERMLMEALSVSKATVNAIKKPANNAEWDVRHATTGEAGSVPPDATAMAVTAAEQIIRAFIYYLYQQRLAAEEA
jgi:hypothetical protein